MSVDCTSSVVWGGLISDDSSSDNESDDVTEISHIFTGSQTDICRKKSSPVSEYDTTNYALCSEQMQISDSNIVLSSLESNNPVYVLDFSGGQNNCAVSNAVQIPAEVGHADIGISSSFAPSVVYLDGARHQERIHDNHHQHSNFEREGSTITKIELEAGGSENGNQCLEKLSLSNATGKTTDVCTNNESVDTVLSDVVECNVGASLSKSNRSKILAKKYSSRAKKNFIKKEPTSPQKQLKVKKAHLKKNVSKPSRLLPEEKVCRKLNHTINEMAYARRRFELVHKLDDMTTCHFCSKTFKYLYLKHLHDEKFHVPNTSSTDEAPRHSLLVDAEVLPERTEVTAETERCPAILEQSANSDVQSTTTQHDLSLHKDSGNDVAEIFKCSGCSFEFASEHQMRNHFTLIHVRSHLNACQFCHVNFPQLGNEGSSSNYWLSTHESKYIVSANFQRCTICGSVFNKNKTAFKRHLATHADDKTFQCHTCDLVLDTFVELKCHVLEQACWLRRENSYCVLVCKIERKLTNGFRNNLVCKIPIAIATSTNIPDVAYIRNQIDEKLSDLSFLKITSQSSCVCSQSEDNDKDEEGHVPRCKARKIHCTECGSKLLTQNLRKHKKICNSQRQASIREEVLEVVDSLRGADDKEMNSAADERATSGSKKCCNSTSQESRVPISKIKARKLRPGNGKSFQCEELLEMEDNQKVSKTKRKNTKPTIRNWNKHMTPGLTDIVVSNVVSLAPQTIADEISTCAATGQDYSSHDSLAQPIQEISSAMSHGGDLSCSRHSDLVTSELEEPQSHVPIQLILPDGFYLLCVPSKPPVEDVYGISEIKSNSHWDNHQPMVLVDAEDSRPNHVSASEMDGSVTLVDNAVENDTDTSFVVESDGSGDSGFGQLYCVEAQSEIEEELLTTIETSTLGSHDGYHVKQELNS